MLEVTVKNNSSINMIQLIFRNDLPRMLCKTYKQYTPFVQYSNFIFA